MQRSTYQLIERIKQGEKTALHEVYLEHKSSFLEWAAATFHCNQEDAEDVWQEVIIAFYENIVEGKLTELKSQVRTYLFGIGRFMLLRKYEQQKRWAEMPEQESEEGQWIEKAASEHNIELSDQQRMLGGQLQKLGKNCQRLLTLFYYQRFSTESIMNEMGYKSAAVAKSQKARCMRSLRQNMAQFKNEF